MDDVETIARLVGDWVVDEAEGSQRGETRQWVEILELGETIVGEDEGLEVGQEGREVGSDARHAVVAQQHRAQPLEQREVLELRDLIVR